MTATGSYEGRRLWMAVGTCLPLMVEQGQLVGKRRSVRKNGFPLGVFEMDLGRVERHHEDRYSRGKKRLRPGWIAIDIPLRIGWTALAIGSVVPTIDTAAHQHNALELGEGCRILLDGLFHIAERADGDEGDCAGMLTNLVEQEAHAGGMNGFRPTGSVDLLREDVGVRSRHAGGDGDVFAANGVQVAIDEAGTQLGISKCGGDAEQFEFGAAQGQCEGERVVDIVADVGIEDRQLRSGRGTRSCHLANSEFDSRKSRGHGTHRNDKSQKSSCTPL